MSGKFVRVLPWVFVALAAGSRWPGLLPSNFSLFYGLAFCAGAFFPSRTRWWLPLGTLVATDILLALFYYHRFELSQLVNYAAYGGIIWFGTRFNHRSPFLGLLAGGILGAIFFYLITNTAAWLANPEYPKDLAGWITALTRGTSGYPPTWEFFRNTLTSGGLFTGLFAGAMKLTAPAESEEEEETEEEPEGAEPAEAET